MGAAGTFQGQRCNRCGEVRALEEFGFKYPDRALRTSRCRECVRQVSRIYYQRDPANYKARALAASRVARARNREMLRDFLRDAACQDCGIADIAILEFDHREPNDKSYDVSGLVGRPYAWSTVLDEIAKCDVVCANCHRRRTARHFGWRKLRGMEGLVLPALPRRATPEYPPIKSVRRDLARRHRNRSHLLDFLRQHPCVSCGEKDPVVLEFDHLGEKRRDVTVLAMRGGRARLIAEMAKCQILCANCHRRHTAQQAGRSR